MPIWENLVVGGRGRRESRNHERYSIAIAIATGRGNYTSASDQFFFLVRLEYLAYRRCRPGHGSPAPEPVRARSRDTFYDFRLVLELSLAQFTASRVFVSSWTLKAQCPADPEHDTGAGGDPESHHLQSAFLGALGPPHTRHLSPAERSSVRRCYCQISTHAEPAEDPTASGHAQDAHRLSAPPSGGEGSGRDARPV